MNYALAFLLIVWKGQRQIKTNRVKLVLMADTFQEWLFFWYPKRAIASFKMELSPLNAKIYTHCEKMRDANIMTKANRFLQRTHLSFLFRFLGAQAASFSNCQNNTRAAPRAQQQQQQHKTGATPTASGENWQIMCGTKERADSVLSQWMFLNSLKYILVAERQVLSYRKKNKRQNWPIYQ